MLRQAQGTENWARAAPLPKPKEGVGAAVLLHHTVLGADGGFPGVDARKAAVSPQNSVVQEDCSTHALFWFGERGGSSPVFRALRLPEQDMARWPSPYCTVYEADPAENFNWRGVVVFRPRH